MKRNILPYIFITLTVLTSCKQKPSEPSRDFDKGMVAHFRFEANNSSKIVDETKNLADKVVAYHLHNSATSPRQEVQFKDGVEGSAMVFDGYSTFATYDSSEIMMSGTALAISAWIAPRVYNYADAHAKDDELQAIVSQYYKDDSLAMGFTLGYKREGKLSFGIGTNNGWFQIWDEGSPLKQYEWNSVLAVFDGKNNEILLYLNGRIINRMIIPLHSEIIACDEPLTIGKNTITSSSGDSMMGIVSGLMDDLRLYNRVVSFKEYKEYYNSLLINGSIKSVDFSDVWIQNTLTNDLYKPQYHGGPYEHWMNEPHAPFYYKGIYHLFFQFNANGPYFNDARGIMWGHLTSPDMVVWTPQKEVVVPTIGTVAPDGIWSGASTLDKDGNPVLFFTAGNYAHPGLISNQNVGLATPKDLNDPLLIEWETSDRLAIAQKGGEGRSGEFRDPSIIQEGDDYYLVIGTGDENSNRGSVLIYHTNKNKTDYLHNWEYKGHLFDYANNDPQYGVVWELPVLLPLKNSKGEQSDKYVLVISPAPATTADNNIIYWVGTFNKTTYRFIADHVNPRRMDYGRNVFTGPSGFVDPISGETKMFSILQSHRSSKDLSASGWSHNVGLTRSLYYDDKRNDLGITIISDVINSLANNVIYDASGKDITTINNDLKQFNSDMYALEIKLQNLTDRFEIKVRSSSDESEYSAIYIDSVNKQAGVNTALNQNGNSWSSVDVNGHLTNTTNPTITVYIDRSQIETIFNSEKTISARSYPRDLTANGLSFTMKGGGEIEKVTIYSLQSIYA